MVQTGSRSYLPQQNRGARQQKDADFFRVPNCRIAALHNSGCDYPVGFGSCAHGLVSKITAITTMIDSLHYATPYRLMVPSNNTTMEGELLAWLPAGSTVTTAKIPRGPGLLTQETIPAYRDNAISLARQHFRKGEFDLSRTAVNYVLTPLIAHLAILLLRVAGSQITTDKSAVAQLAGFFFWQHK